MYIKFIAKNDKYFTALTKIDKGNYGTVYETTAKDQHAPFHQQRIAIKVVERQDEYLREIDHFYQLQTHPGVVTLLGIYFTAKQSLLCFEYAESNLMKYLRSFPLNQDTYIEYYRTTFEWWKNISHAVYLMNSVYGILHRDLKPENILLVRRSDGTLQPKLADLGLSKCFFSIWDGNEKPAIKDNIWYSVYSACYRAPELWHETDNVDQFEKENHVNLEKKLWKEYDPSTEAWAMACILFDIASHGVRIFTGSTLTEVRDSIKTFLFKNYPHVFDIDFSSPCMDYGKIDHNNKHFISIDRVLEKAMFKAITGTSLKKTTGSASKLPSDLRPYFHTFSFLLKRLMHPHPKSRMSLHELFPLEIIQHQPHATIVNPPLADLNLKSMVVQIMQTCMQFPEIQQTEANYFFQSILMFVYSILHSSAIRDSIFQYSHWIMYLGSLSLLEDYRISPSKTLLSNLLIDHLLKNPEWVQPFKSLLEEDIFKYRSFRKKVMVAADLILHATNCSFARFSTAFFLKPYFDTNEKNWSRWHISLANNLYRFFVESEHLIFPDLKLLLPASERILSSSSSLMSEDESP